MNFNQNMVHTKHIKFAPVANWIERLATDQEVLGSNPERTNYMSIFDNKINRIIIISFFIKLTFTIFFHEKNLSEMSILFQNFQTLNPIVIIFSMAKPYLVHTYLCILHLFILIKF